jgi:hypothetical protein
MKMNFPWTGWMSLGALVAGNAFAADLTLYADDDYQGRAVGVVIDERQLGVLNFDDKASSVVVEDGAWVLCSGEDYTGDCITLEPGRYASLQALGLNDEITSVRRRDPVSVGSFGRIDTPANPPRPAPRRATEIVLYVSNEYAGASQPVDGPQTADLSSEPIQSKATSAVIAAGEWQLCDDTYYRGQCVTLGPGKYPSLELYGLTHGVSSVRKTGESPHRVEKPAGQQP